MKNYYLIIILIISSIIISACQSDQDNNDAEKPPSIDEISNSKSSENTIVKDSTEIDKKEKPDKTNKEIISEEEQEEKIKKEAAELRRAKDIDELIPSLVNTKINPDNLNMAFETKRKDSYVDLFPLLFENEKTSYHIQFLVSVNKYSIQKLEKIFADSVIVYVTSHKGLYKYSIGKFDSQDEARAKINDYKTKHDLEDAVIAYYGEAF